MATENQFQFSLKVVVIKEREKVLYAAVESDFADVLLSFLTLPLGTIVRLLIKHYGNYAPVLGSLNSLYAGLQDMHGSHFCTEAGRLMLLNPRNVSGIHCSRLKLQIDDTPPIQYFRCRYWSCASIYYNMECCSAITNKEITRKDFETETQSVGQSVFTEETSSFLLTDDLQILPNTSASFFQILKENGIQNTKELEERTLIVGLNEIMELLKGSLVSNAPITDIILSMSTDPSTLSDTDPATLSIGRKKKFTAVLAKSEPEALPQTQTSKNLDSDSKKITIKAIVQKSTNRVLLAQTKEDFIDLLFGLLALPLGRVQFLLGNNTCLGSIGNLYRSTSNLEVGEYVKSRETQTRLLEPQIPPYYLSFDQIFSLDKQSISTVYKGYENCEHKLFFSTPNKKDVEHVAKMVMINPRGQDSFFKGPRMFMVTDDLKVSNQPSIYIFSTLDKMKIRPSDVEEQELGIGMEEALSILKAAVKSACALSEGLKPFLKRQPKQEK